MTVVKTTLSELIEAYESNPNSELVKEIIWALENYSEEWEELIYDLKVFNPKKRSG